MSIFDNFETVHCVTCRIPITLPIATMAELRSRGTAFTCINGHRQSFTGEVEKLKKQKADLEAEVDKWKVRAKAWEDNYDGEVEANAHAVRRINSLRGVITRMKNKAKRDV